jgi:glycosyltransferase involved in cell wall biosynthesis
MSSNGLPQHDASTNWLSQFSIAVVIPCYKVEKEIESVLRSIPSYICHIIVVNDASPDRSREVVENAAADDPRIILLNHEKNQGVGGAMITGFHKALQLGAQLVVKLDGDGQMSVADIPGLLGPLIRGEADYCKGNRFRDFQALRRMPWIRRAGNMALSFLVKAATGYWSCFDPTNGFIGIRGNVLAQLPLEKVHRTYFFETSMLGQLYMIDAVVRDISLPARYHSEISNLSIGKVLREFPFRLLGCFWRRMILKNYIYDFKMESVLMLCGVPMLMAGLLYGGMNWIRYARSGRGAPTGTVVIPAMMIILGFQILLSAVGADLQAVPREPICGGPLPGQETQSRASRQEIASGQAGK